MKAIGRSIRWLLSSFDNYSVGASARKILAYVMATCIVYIHAKLLRDVDAVSAIMWDGIIMFVLLGLITIPQLIEFLKARGGEVFTKETTTEKNKVVVVEKTAPDKEENIIKD